MTDPHLVAFRDQMGAAKAAARDLLEETDREAGFVRSPTDELTKAQQADVIERLRDSGWCRHIQPDAPRPAFAPLNIPAYICCEDCLDQLAALRMPKVRCDLCYQRCKTLTGRWWQYGWCIVIAELCPDCDP